MARIELRDTDIVLQDGLAGTAAVNQPGAVPVVTDTALTIDTNVLNTADTQKVPIGARFTIAGETTPQAHIVTGRTQGGAGVNAKQSVGIDDASSNGTFTLSWGGKTTAAIAFDATSATVKAALVAMDDGYTTNDWDVTGGPGPTTDWVVEFKGALGAGPRALLVGVGTSLVGGSTTVAVITTVIGVPAATSAVTTAITFSPALGAGTYADGGVITFAPQELEIKVGDGNITYSEKMEYEYLLDRGDLDTVREGKQIPLDVKLECVYEHITTGTSEQISPMDALKGKGAASEWVSSSVDLCEPYCISVLVRHTPPCGTAEREQTAFPMFRPDSRDIDLAKATISVSGKCKAVEPQVDRVAAGAAWPAVA